MKPNIDLYKKFEKELLLLKETQHNKEEEYSFIDKMELLWYSLNVEEQNTL